MDRQFLKVRLDFLFRHIQACYAVCDKNSKSEEFIAEFASLTITVGIVQILERPIRSVKSSLPTNAEVIGEMITEDFNKLAQWCHQEQNSGLPITITMTKIELEIMHCIENLADKIIKEIKP